MSEENLQIKETPVCPKCGHHMKVAGQLRTERKIKTIFQCMALGCNNHMNYTRKGAVIGGSEPQDFTKGG